MSITLEHCCALTASYEELLKKNNYLPSLCGIVLVQEIIFFVRFSPKSFSVVLCHYFRRSGCTSPTYPHTLELPTGCTIRPLTGSTCDVIISCSSQTCHFNTRDQKTLNLNRSHLRLCSLQFRLRSDALSSMRLALNRFENK